MYSIVTAARTKHIFTWKIAFCFIFAFFMALTVLIFSPTEKAEAWDSYDGPIAQIKADPLHEDMTQMAYVRIVQYAKDHPNVNNLIYVGASYVGDKEAAYQDRLEYLRQGAFWNDVPADNSIEFYENYVRCEWIPKYTNAKYLGAADIGQHLAETVIYANQEDDWWINDPRGGVRMSHNRRGNVLHSMLGVQADGNSYITHAQEKEWTLQWLKVAYKYAQGETITDPNELKILNFIDPYSQIKSNPTKTGGDATRDLSTTQGRLRALGMMCHTLEDSYNPAHTVRSYFGDASGEILAFGVYEIQSLHADYDHINSFVDQDVREDFLDGTGTLEDALAYADAGGEVGKLQTLALRDASEAAYGLLYLFYNDASWDDVYEWLDEDVFVTSLNGDESYIYEGGRRAGDMDKLEDKAIGTAKALKKLFPDKADEISVICDQYADLIYYQITLNLFYHLNTYDGNYHAPSNVEEAGRTAVRTAIDGYYDLIAETPGIAGILAKMNPADRATLKDLIEDTNGIVQEFKLDLDGNYDMEYQSMTNTLVGLLENTTGIATGSIEALSASDLVLRLNDGGGNILVTANDSMLSSLTIGQQNVTVTYKITQPYDKFYYYNFEATSINAGTGTNFQNSKGVVTEIATDQSSITVAIEGTGTDSDIEFTFAVDSSHPIPASIVKDARILLEYTYDDHALHFYNATLLRIPAKPLENITGNIVSYYGNTVLLQIDASIDNQIWPVIIAFDYADADFIGSLAIGSSATIHYYNDQGEDLYDLDKYDDTVINSFEASRIKVNSHDAKHSDLIYTSNDDATHQKICSLLDLNALENCTVGDNNNCPLCGYHFETFTISGTVTDKETGEVARAVLQLYDAQGNKVGTAYSVDITNGKYTIEEVYRGKGYYVMAFCYGYYDGTSAAFDVTDSNITGIDFKLDARSSPMNVFNVSGKVTDEATGQGIPAALQLKDSMGEAVGAVVYASSDGAYTITQVIPGSGYTVEAAMPGYVTRSSSPFDILFTHETGVIIALSTSPVVTPYLTQGNGAVWYQGSSEGLLFVSSADYATFLSVVVDKKTLVEGTDFSKEPGSIHVTLTPNFLNSLEVGQHSIAIDSTQGVASGAFTIAAQPQPTPKPSPATGDSTPALIWALVAVALVALVAITVVVIRNRRHR